MNSYAKTKIYKIISSNTDKYYIGSTKEHYLSSRLKDHRFKAKNNYGITSSEIINAGDYKIVLIENYPCNSIEEQKQREQYYLDLYKDDENLVNKLNANGINKERKKQRGHEYYENNKEYLKEKQNEWREKNKQEIKIQKKNHYEKNKANILETAKIKIECPNCGCMTRKSDISRHKKTKKCINYKNNI